MSFMPKQSLQNGIKKISIASKEFAEKVEISVDNRIASETSVLSAKVGTEKDGFQSITMSVDKGSATEGPVVTFMTEDVNGATTKQTVDFQAILEGLTGKGNVDGAVLNESIQQGSVKGMQATLDQVVKMPKEKQKKAFPTASPLPTKVEAAIEVEQEGGVAKVLAQETQKASAAVSEELKQPFGHKNLFGSVQSGIGNILGQIAAISSNSKTLYTDPKIPLSLNDAAETLNEKGVKVPTPDVVLPSGKTNLKKVVTKSATTNPKVESTTTPVVVGETDAKWDGIFTRVKKEGGSFEFPQIINKDHLRGELLKIEREISTLIVSTHNPRFYENTQPQTVHINMRKRNIKKHGNAKVTATPKDYAVPAHIWMNGDVAVYKMVPFDEEIPVSGDEEKRKKYEGCMFLFISIQNGKDFSNYHGDVWKALDFVFECFLDVFPGIEILGLNQIAGNEGKNNPHFDVREYVLTQFNKDSTTEGVVEKIPTASEISDLPPTQTKQIPIPSHSQVVDVTKRISEITGEDIPPVPESEYKKVQEDALAAINQKNNLFNEVIRETGSGNLGGALDAIKRHDATAQGGLKSAQSLKIDNLKKNKVFNAISNAFEKVIK
jgi:hypothetical protein